MKEKSFYSGIRHHLQDKKVSTAGGIAVVTDRVDYPQTDQVFPLHPENQFYIDEIDKEKIKDASALEIGTGSGILSIAAVRAGAAHVTTLEINPRARIFAGFNILMNGLESVIELKDGNNNNPFEPVQGKQFGYIISNPPFEPTPLGVDYYLHSSGGIYGLEFVETILKNLGSYLADKGHAQVVTFAPGNEKQPFMLTDLAEKYLDGKATIKVNPVSIGFDCFVDRFFDIGKATKKQVEEMKIRAAKDKVTHLYLCMLHYEKGVKSISVEKSKKAYGRWDLPMGSSVPMGKT